MADHGVSPVPTLAIVEALINDAPVSGLPAQPHEDDRAPVCCQLLRVSLPARPLEVLPSELFNQHTVRLKSRQTLCRPADVLVLLLELAQILLGNGSIVAHTAVADAVAVRTDRGVLYIRRIALTSGL